MQFALTRSAALWLAFWPLALAAQLLEESDWSEVQPGAEVKLLAHSEGRGIEQYALCRSAERRQKEAAIREGQRQRLRAQLAKTDRSLRQRPARDTGKIERRIGQYLGPRSCWK